MAIAVSFGIVLLLDFLQALIFSSSHPETQYNVADQARRIGKQKVVSHPNKSVAFEDITQSLDENRELSVQIERPARTADQRLAEMWSEVRKET